MRVSSTDSVRRKAVWGARLTLASLSLGLLLFSSSSVFAASHHARAVQKTLGLTGAGVGVAIIDSGIATWHDDLTVASGSASFPFGNQRVAAFMDFVNGQLLPYDDNGHGSHVAGIIAGNGVDSNGKRMGAAPDASLVSLKVLDANGSGASRQVIQGPGLGLGKPAQEKNPVRKK